MSVLARVDLDQALPRAEYKPALVEAQVRLRELALRCYQEKRSVVLVFEGWDAAGKGGAIRRLTGKLDPRGVHVYSIAAPEGDDAHRHYLWRFWRRLLPADEKQVVIFDRSWYGRVLVERVEGFATEEEWRRAYREINEFERQLANGGAIVAKYWFHIDKDEQWRRFEARRQTPHKRWKLTDEDLRNREKWPDYEAAADEMLLKTSTRDAPWTVIAANDKYHALVRCVRHVVDTLDRALATTPKES